jgi:hypothetical protein
MSITSGSGRLTTRSDCVVSPWPIYTIENPNYEWLSKLSTYDAIISLPVYCSVLGGLFDCFPGCMSAARKQDRVLSTLTPSAMARLEATLTAPSRPRNRLVC